MEEDIHALYPGDESLGVHGVGAVGVASPGLGVAVVLGEEEAARGDLMAQGERLDGECSVLVDDLVLARVDRLKMTSKERSAQW